MKKTIKKLLQIGLILICSPFILSAKTKYISPNNDGVQDELLIPLHISEKRYVQGWSLIIMDSDHNVVRTIGNKVALPEKVGFKSFFKQLVTPKQGVTIPESVSWNGAMNNGETAPDGTYFYYLTATDDNGNVGQTKEYQVVIDTVAPEVELAQPSDKIFGEGAKAALKIKQTGSEEDLWTGTFKGVDGNVVKTFKWENSEPMEFNWNGSDDTGAQLPDGVYSYEITATDRAGNVSPSSTITNIIYSADKPATNIFVDGSRYFSPGTESELKVVAFNLTIPVPDSKTKNMLTEWAVDVADKNGKIVRSYNQNNVGANPPDAIVFDGCDENGKVLSDGEYQATVSAKYLNGYVPAKVSSPVIVLDTKKPEAQIKASETVFGGGTKPTVKFSIFITPSLGSPVPGWKGELKNAESGAVVKSFDFGEYPPESVVWDGITAKGELAAKGDYVLELSATDLAGNTGIWQTSKGVTFDTTESKLLLSLSDSAFSPNADKVKDSIIFTPVTATKDVAAYEFNVKDKTGATVYTQKADKALPVNFVWNGFDNSKVPCDDGEYYAALFIRAQNGSEADAVTQMFVLDTVHPSLSAEIPWSAFSPDGDGNQDDIPVTITQISSEKLWTADVRNAKDLSVKKFSWNGTKESFVWDGTDESGNIAEDGVYSIVLYSTDDAGNSFSKELKGITLDNRETKAYITAASEGISPNGDGILDTQLFEIKTSVKENILSWNFDIRREDGTPVYSWSEKDSKNLPASITWNGGNAEGKVCEGTFTGTLNLIYEKGNRVSAVSSPFVCTAIAPELKVRTAPQYFSPDNDGVDDDLFIKLTGNTKAKIKNWSFVIKDPKGRDFWKTSGKAQITERIIWDGLSNVQKTSSGNAERVQSAMDYPYEFTVSDNLGMTSTVTGVIPVDVLVIRDGSQLKMAVPSIIFESDEANFMNATAKLTAEQVERNKVILDRIADILKKFKDYKVEIVGHANRLTDDPLEETEDNMRKWGKASTPLSEARANAIRDYLIKRGVSGASLTASGLGGTRPVVDPKDKDNNWKNRRVEFILEK